jgi:hypothetical protein
LPAKEAIDDERGIGADQFSPGRNTKAGTIETDPNAETIKYMQRSSARIIEVESVDAARRSRDAKVANGHRAFETVRRSAVNRDCLRSVVGNENRGLLD